MNEQIVQVVIDNVTEVTVEETTVTHELSVTNGNTVSLEAGDQPLVTLETSIVRQIIQDGAATKFAAQTETNVIFGQPLHLGQTGNVRVADSTHNNVVGLCVKGAQASYQTEYLAIGKIEMSDWTAIVGSVNLTPGSIYYLSGSGLLDTTPLNNIVVKVGVGLTSKILMIILPWRIHRNGG